MFARFNRKMRAVLIVAAVVFLGCVGLAIYGQYLFEFYPEHAVTAFMGTTEHRTTAKRHSEYDWYIQVAISSGQGDSLLRRHSFHPGYAPSITGSKIPSPDIPTCTGCWTYYEDQGRGIFGYLLAVLSQDKKELQLYEFFGD